MKLIKQFLIIIAISLIGEVLSVVVLLPIPGSIYGLVLMFLALYFKVIHVHSVKETSGFLIDIMPIMFVPPGVCILETLDVLKAHWWQLLVLTVVSTFVVMVVSGIVTQVVMNSLNKKRGE